MSWFSFAGKQHSVRVTVAVLLERTAGSLSRYA
jgi:hypothetical protein